MFFDLFYFLFQSKSVKFIDIFRGKAQLHFKLTDALYYKFFWALKVEKRLILMYFDDNIDY